jgi:hypothetical protein
LFESIYKSALFLALALFCSMADAKCPIDLTIDGEETSESKAFCEFWMATEKLADYVTERYGADSWAEAKNFKPDPDSIVSVTLTFYDIGPTAASSFQKILDENSLALPVTVNEVTVNDALTWVRSGTSWKLDYDDSSILVGDRNNCGSPIDFVRELKTKTEVIIEGLKDNEPLKEQMTSFHLEVTKRFFDRC